MNIIRERPRPDALRCVIYGPEGIGKSTLASQFPSPVVIDTEGSTKFLDVARFDSTPASWDELMGQVRYCATHDVGKTVVIDTIDWAERLCIQSVCQKWQLKSIESAGYGKGYVYLAEEFEKLLNLLGDLVDKYHLNVVLVAHAIMRKFEQPDEAGAYDRWELKLSKKVAPMVKEWADMLLFINYKTYAVTDDTTGKRKARGGQRVIYTSHHPCWDAKNRMNMPEELPLSFDSLKDIIPGTGAYTTPQEPETEDLYELEEDEPETETSEWPAAITLDDLYGDTEEPPMEETNENTPWDVWPLVPPDDATDAMKELYRRMNDTRTTPEEVQNATTAAGYFPSGMLLSEYPDDFVAGCLVGAWPDVYRKIQAMKKEEKSNA